MKTYRYLDLILAAFVAVLLTSNLVANKLVQVGSLVLTAGVFLFPISYLFGDILTEVYGYGRTRRVIWVGFALQLVMLAGIVLAIALPAAIPEHGRAFRIALQTSPWIVFGSLAGYWCGEFVNSYVLARLKLLTAGRWLWTRTIGSTVAGQAVDTVVFVAIAFLFGAGLPLAIAVRLAVSLYLVKCAVEVVMTPATYAIVTALKRAEQVDYYDTKTNFNPFTLTEAQS